MERLFLFCYFFDLPRIARFNSALDLMDSSGTIICFDFQADVLRALLRQQGALFKPLTSSNLRGGSSHKQKKMIACLMAAPFGHPRHSLILAAFWGRYWAITQLGNRAAAFPGTAHLRWRRRPTFYLPDLSAAPSLWGIRCSDLHRPAGYPAPDGDEDGLRVMPANMIPTGISSIRPGEPMAPPAG
ncbi:MAG: hypothetical protein ACLVD8_25700 [Enterocloster sp.]|uniref:hypothetical protein n=1 Tax=Enterocloster sp. TaxID=2719315 RepID=UPI00399A318E